MSLARRCRAVCLSLLAAALSLPAAAQSGNMDIDLVGGAYDGLTSLQLKGTPGRKYLLLVSVFKSPGLSFIPNQSTDVGTEFLNLSLSIPGFTGVFGGAGTATALIVVPYFPQLDTFPLYFQLFETGATGNKLVDKSAVQTLTMQASGTWKQPFVGKDYAVQRSTHTMTLLPGERVLTLGGGTGGITTSYGQDTAEMYALSDESLAVLGATMQQPRTGHSATLLDDGRVLIVGGADDVLGEPTATAEVFNPATGLFSAVGGLVGGPRALHRAFKLDDGRVLIAGGTDNYIDPTSILLGANPITSASALVNLQGANVLLNVQGNVVLKAGKATAVAGGNTANSSAAIVATAAFDPASRIFGNLTIQGGVAIAEPIGGQVGNAQSTSKLQTAGNLDLTVQGNLSVLGGTANATASSGSRNIITTSTSR